MMLHFLRVTSELFGLQPVGQKPDRPPSWELRARCENSSESSCLFVQQLVALSKENERDGRDAQEKVVFLAAVAAKRKDKLSKSEKDSLEQEITLYLNAEANHSLVEVELQQ